MRSTFSTIYFTFFFPILFSPILLFCLFGLKGKLYNLESNGIADTAHENQLILWLEPEFRKLCSLGDSKGWVLKTFKWNGCILILKLSAVLTFTSLTSGQKYSKGKRNVVCNIMSCCFSGLSPCWEKQSWEPWQHVSVHWPTNAESQGSFQKQRQHGIICVCHSMWQRVLNLTKLSPLS
jgi:hypothetical protein